MCACKYARRVYLSRCKLKVITRPFLRYARGLARLFLGEARSRGAEGRRLLRDLRGRDKCVCVYKYLPRRYGPFSPPRTTISVATTYTLFSLILSLTIYLSLSLTRRHPRITTAPRAAITVSLAHLRLGFSRAHLINLNGRGSPAVFVCRGVSRLSATTAVGRSRVRTRNVVTRNRRRGPSMGSRAETRCRARSTNNGNYLLSLFYRKRFTVLFYRQSTRNAHCHACAAFERDRLSRV